jgi:hypothetical protein
MSLPPIITQFKPVKDQWELNDDNIKRIDQRTGKTILHNYCGYIKTTPLGVYRYLIETKGCDINVQDKYNDIPLHRAFENFNPDNGELGDSITVNAILRPISIIHMVILCFIWLVNVLTISHLMYLRY